MVNDPGRVDLHAHTCFSDGLFTPEELVARAARLGLAAVGVTDHDTVAGIDRARAAGKRDGVEIVPGAELSCTVDGTDVHILGYYIDCRDPDVTGFFADLRRARFDRAVKMVELLDGLGIRVTLEQVERSATGAAVGRPHVAQAMVEAGAVGSMEEAFKRFLGYDGPAYVPKKRLTPEEAVGFIHRHHGVAVLAHPGIYRRDTALYAAIGAGVDGIEVWHPDHDTAESARLFEVAEKNGLLVTGGSDCHGGRKKGHIYLGEVAVEYKYLAAIKRLARR
ncbi:PHP domain-containing protein, partial [candidate division WOR-3 bacterium]|nr:PHP domain-containing protein [candidate division WOR-3 bacterium]